MDTFTKVGSILTFKSDSKIETINKNLKIAFSEIRRDIELHQEQINSLKEKIEDMKKKIRRLEDEKIKITPLMENILESLGNDELNSKELYEKLKKHGIEIHEKSIPRSIKALLKMEKIIKIKGSKSYKYKKSIKNDDIEGIEII